MDMSGETNKNNTCDFLWNLKHVVPNLRYTLKACIDRPWKFDHEVVQMFTVLDVIDLNIELPNFLQPVLKESHDTVGCCCWVVMQNFLLTSHCPLAEILQKIILIQGKQLIRPFNELV